MGGFPKETSPTVLFFISPGRQTDVGLFGNLAFLKGIHTFSIVPAGLGELAPVKSTGLKRDCVLANATVSGMMAACTDIRPNR